MGTDDDESFLGVCEIRVLGAAEVRLRSASAVVHGDDKWSGVRERRRLVQVHLHICGVGAEVRSDLLERAGKSVR